MKPIAVDFYCGLGGWAEGFLAEGYEVIGFDIKQHDYGTGGYPSQLVLQDVRTICGCQFKSLLHRIACFVASPPCTEYSYMAMPWKRAKQIARALRGHDEFPAGYKGSRTIEELNALFNACFSIQREASELASRHIPMVVENVKGAQPWVGDAKWHFGSYYLWGDVPALMPYRFGAYKVPSFRFDGSGRSFQTASVRCTNVGNGARFTSRDCGVEGVKQRGSGREWFAGEGKISRMTSSNSEARARASAEIAKIPFPLAQHIAKTFQPTHEEEK